MENNKKHIIFDLDDTLWDFQKNSQNALIQLITEFGLVNYGIKPQNFVATFRRINGALWDQFDRGEITRSEIRKERFPSIFKEFDLKLNGVAIQMQDRFMSICSAQPILVSGVLQVLEQFRSKYKFHVLSNGFDEVQFIKIKASGLEPYFDKIITSGRAGYRKPEPEIFNFTLQEIGTVASECVMIGDNPISDIEGAYNYGMDQIYYNVHNKECAISPNHTIYNMYELLEIL